MTAAKYFEICEQLGQEVNFDKIPMEFSDLPEIAQDAISMFHTLGDRVSEAGYLGKDFTLFPTLLDIYEIDDTELLIQIVSWLDSRAIKKASEEQKKHLDKLKRQKHGQK